LGMTMQAATPFSTMARSSAAVDALDRIGVNLQHLHAHTFDRLYQRIVGG
jgi:hypothetical protein